MRLVIDSEANTIELLSNIRVDSIHPTLKRILGESMDNYVIVPPGTVIEIKKSPFIGETDEELNEKYRCRKEIPLTDMSVINRSKIFGDEKCVVNAATITQPINKWMTDIKCDG